MKLGTRRTLLSCFFVLLSFYLVAADEGDEGEQIQSLNEERKELLLYGIDSQVLELIDDLKEERDDNLIEEVHAVLKATRNPKIRSSIFDFFRSVEYKEAGGEALLILDTYEDQVTDLVLSSIRYLTVEPTQELALRLEPLLESADQEVVRIALKGIGLSGGAGTVELLLNYLDDPDFPSNLKPEIILSLGDLGDTAAIEPLVEILEDTGEEAIWRRYACASLGKIGDPAILPVIEKVLYDDDALLRSYAVGALRYFETNDVVPMLIEGLRDSFWRVRISAAAGLGEKQAEQAVPILIFKAEKDPEMNVREEALRSLGKIATDDAFDFLRNSYLSERTPQGLRILSAEILSEKDLANSLDDFKEVIANHWDKENSRVLERSAYYLSLAESSLLESFYSKFLESGELAIIIYGIRGVARNHVISLKEVVEKYSAEGNHRSIRKAALSAMEELE